MQNANKRTDLAVETHELNIEERQYKGEVRNKDDNIYGDGVAIENEGNDEIKITRVIIKNQEGEKTFGKPVGSYITIEAPRLGSNSKDLYENICRVVASEIKRLVKLDEKATVLVVGLGNWNITPDALGPRVLSFLMVTRHLHEYVPEEIDEGVRPVCSISPGVLGLTGIETSEIVKGVVDKVNPSLVIAIDALSSRKLDRLNTTIQIADTGIAPGSGVGNKRMELSIESLGVPVIAIGVPTVVDAATMANDTIDLVIDSLINELQKDSDFYNTIKNIDRNEKYSLIREVLEPFGGNLVVTPKEMDEVIDKMAKIIANGINIALHKDIDFNDIDRYIN